MKVLVTGATGFVGRAFVTEILRHEISACAAVRGPEFMLSGNNLEVVTVGDVNGYTDWSAALKDVTEVVHLVARTHMIGEANGGDLADYRPVNVDGTRHLAEQAASAGVRRIVYVSSVKVNGEHTLNRAFAAHDIPAPEDAYGISKWEAEKALIDVCERTGLEFVVIRPPLIYGPGVKANFARLIRWVKIGIPLPFGAISNRRSMVSLPNLIDLIFRSLESPKAANETFMASDGRDVSTPDLIRLLAGAMARKPRLIPVPLWLLTLAGDIFNRGPEVKRLTGSLAVDLKYTRETLDWVPPISVEEGIKRTLGS